MDFERLKMDLNIVICVLMFAWGVDRNKPEDIMEYSYTWLCIFLIVSQLLAALLKSHRGN